MRKKVAAGLALAMALSVAAPSISQARGYGAPGYGHGYYTAGYSGGYGYGGYACPQPCPPTYYTSTYCDPCDPCAGGGFGGGGLLPLLGLGLIGAALLH